MTVFEDRLTRLMTDAADRIDVSADVRSVTAASDVPVRADVPGRRRSVVLAASIVSLLGIAALGVVVATTRGSSDTAATDSLPTSQSADTEPAEIEGASYALSLEGTTPLPRQELTAGTTDSVVWFDEASGVYLTLTVRFGLAAAYPAPTALGPMEQSRSFPSMEGEAWLTQTTTPGTPITMWWSRPDGDVWIMTAYWYGRDVVAADEARSSVEQWALLVRPPREDAGERGRYELDAPMTRVAEDTAGDVASVAHVWRHDGDSGGGEIVLLSIDDAVAAGLSNLLAVGKPEHVEVLGHGALQARAVTGDIVVGWQPPGPTERWVTLTVPAALAELTPTILEGLSSS